MSLCFPTAGSNSGREQSPSIADDDNNERTQKTGRNFDDEPNKNLEIDEDSSSIYISESDSSDDERTKPSYPPIVGHIVNTLSAVGTFGGLALIITGGMGMTLNKPIDNTMENTAMVLSGGALLVGSWVGNIALANHQTA